MPAAGLDFGAIAAGGVGVTQAIEVANGSDFPITVRVSGRGGSADVRPLELAHCRPYSVFSVFLPISQSASQCTA